MTTNTNEIRDGNWAELKGGMAPMCFEVHGVLLQEGALTTRRLAEVMGVEVVCVRPRVTDLKGLGLVRCVGRHRDGRLSEGIYEAVSLEEAEKNFEAEQTGGTRDQSLLKC